MENIQEYYKRILKGQDLSLPEKKSWELILENNKNNEDSIAYSEDERKIYYGQLEDEFKKYAKALTSLGITKENNSRILPLTPNLIEAGLVNNAADITGAVVDFVDPTSKIETLKQYIVNEKATDIVVLDLIYMKELKKYTEELKKDYGIRNIILFDNLLANTILPKHMQKAMRLFQSLPSFDKNTKRMSDVIRNSKYTQIHYDEYDKDATSIITHTSGTTTGIGKPIPITDFNRNALYYQHKLAGLTFRPGMKILHFIPYFAAYGSINSAHLGLCCGMELVQVPYFRPEDFGEYLRIYSPNIVFANAPAWESLLSNPTYANLDLSTLECAISGGTPISEKKELEVSKFLVEHGAKCVLTKGHGLSELCGCGSYTLDGYNKVGEMGVPLPMTEYAIRDLSTDEVIFEEKKRIEGEALISSPTLTSGILDDKIVVKTIVINGKRYLPTKDIVIKNEDGSLKYVERIDRMFPRYDAYKVYPLNIENLITSIEGFDECVITSYTDEEKNGKMPVAYIKLSEGFKTDNMEGYVESIIAKYFIQSYDNGVYKANFRDIPTKWVFVDNIPKNTIGKPNYHEIDSKGILGESYIVQLEMNNMGITNMSVQLESQIKLTKKI